VVPPHTLAHRPLAACRCSQASMAALWRPLASNTRQTSGVAATPSRHARQTRDRRHAAGSAPSAQASWNTCDRSQGQRISVDASQNNFGLQQETP
jgi:hypothetical protein